MKGGAAQRHWTSTVSLSSHPLMFRKLCVQRGASAHDPEIKTCVLQ